VVVGCIGKFCGEAIVASDFILDESLTTDKSDGQKRPFVGRCPGSTSPLEPVTQRYLSGNGTAMGPSFKFHFAAVLLQDLARRDGREK
jgi:hypothetical protein